MAAPITLLLPLMQQASTMMREQSGIKAQRHANQIAHEREKYRYKLALAELDLSDQQMRNQRAIMEKLLSSSTQMSGQKLELIREFFTNAADLLRRHQDALFREQDKITDKLNSREVTGVERELDSQRLESISIDLMEISQAMIQMTTDASEIVIRVESVHGILGFSLPRLMGN